MNNLTSLLIKFLFLFTIVLLGGCDNGKEVSPTPTLPTGPVTDAEIKASTPPTFGQLYRAYDSLTTAHPAMLQDEPALARAIFNWVKMHPNGRVRYEQQAQDSK